MVGIYARQSVDKGEQSLSIESQIEECTKRVKQGETLKIYKDKGFSGSNTDRPDFIRLMDDIRNGSVQKLIVWKLDRMSRSLLDFSNIMSVFDERKVVFDSVTEQLDSSTPMGRAMINIIMVFAQLERETIQMRIADNYLKRAERGFFLGGHAPFGLVKKPITVNGYKTSTYELCPEHGKTLQLMFDMYANSDMSFRSLAHYLNDKGRTNNGVLWEAQKISRLIHNPTYVKSNADIYQYYKSKGVVMLHSVDDFVGNGLFLFGKRKPNERKYTNLKDHSLAVALHTGFVDSEIWLKAQYKSEGNVKLGNGGKSQHTWLSGIAKCACCGYAMTGQLMRKDVYLRCSRRTNYNDCDAVSLRADLTETIVWNALLSKLEELRGVEFIQQSKQDITQNGIKTELVKIEEQIECLISAIMDGNGPKSITQRITALEKRQMELEAQLLKEKAKAPEIDTDTILALVKEDLTIEEKKKVSKAIIKLVHVKKDETPVIEWQF